ncbi:MAG TPA: hypothetical protein ENG33_00605, partial [Chloroflexi bacterium]|nr:hypothetical protein [Chloroflexota bacterium]
MRSSKKTPVWVPLSILSVLIIVAIIVSPFQPAFAQAAEGCWYVKANVPTARRALAAVELNGKIYVIGGRDDQRHEFERYDVMERYDPATDTWITLAPMPTKRAWLVAAAVNGKIYAIGGSSAASKLATVEEYDPTTDTWATKTSMPTPRDDAVVGVVNGKIYVIGGWNMVALNVVEEYDPATDTWTTKTPMPAPLAMASSAVVNGKIYVIGGLNGVSVQRKVYEYDPATDTWATRTDMPTARSRLTAGVVGDKIYVIGGYNHSAGWLGTVERYDPATDTWTTMNPMPTRRGDLASAVATDIIYVFGGRTSSNAILDVTEAVDYACTDNPPSQPFNPYPGNWWTGQPLNIILSWMGSDPDPADTLSYSVYFDEGMSPPLVSVDQIPTLYDPPGVLYPGTWYSWRILAKDNHGVVTSSPRWSFKTLGPDNHIDYGSFEATLYPWELAVPGSAQASRSLDKTTAGEGYGSVRIEVTQPGYWMETVKFIHEGINLEEGRSYALFFWAKASVDRPIGITLRESSAPWTIYYATAQEIDTYWHRYKVNFTSGASDTNATLQFGLGEYASTVWLDGIVLLGPTLEVNKTATPSTLSEPGGQVNFTVSVVNHDIEDVVLTSLVDDVYGSLNGKGTCATGIIIEANGGEYTCTFQGTFDDAGDYTNTVTATVLDGDGHLAQAYSSASVTVTDVEPGVEVTKSANPTSLPEPGGTVNFTVVVANTSVEEVTLTSLTDSVYGDLDGRGTCSTGGTIAAGDEYTCSFTGSFTEAGTYINTVTAAVQDNEGNSAQDSDTASVTVTDMEPGVEVSKVAKPASLPEPGGDVTFTVRVSNTGVEAVTLTSLTDSAYGDLDGKGTCSTGGTIAAGAEYTCAFTDS